MRIINSSRIEIINNIKKNIRLIVLIIVISIIIGAVCGIIDVIKYDYRLSNNLNQEEELVSLNSIEKNGGYYYNAFILLKDKYDCLNAYCEYLENVDMSVENKNDLMEVENSLISYKSEIDEAISYFLENAPVEEGYVDNAIDFYEQKRSNLIKEKDELNDDIENLTIENKLNEDEKKQLDELISDKDKIENNIDIFDKQIQLLRNTNIDKLKIVQSNADNILEKNEKLINVIIEDFNEVIYNIAHIEGYEITYNRILINNYEKEAGLINEWEKEKILKDIKNESIIYAKSIAMLDSKIERFFAAITIFFLIGIVISVIVGSFYDSSKR